MRWGKGLTGKNNEGIFQSDSNVLYLMGLIYTGVFIYQSHQWYT